MPNGLHGLISRPIKISFIYILIAGFWVVAFDYVVTVFFSDPQAIRLAANLKGPLLVVVTACVLFWLLYLHRRVIRDSRYSLHKVNRALTTLSGCNRALLDANDEPGLMNEICRLIVESGGYRFAVGWVSPSMTKKRVSVRRPSGAVKAAISRNSTSRGTTPKVGTVPPARRFEPVFRVSFRTSQKARKPRFGARKRSAAIFFRPCPFRS